MVEVGERYKCIITPNKDIEFFTKGQIYTGERLGCLTDNFGNVNHETPEGFIFKYFYKEPENNHPDYMVDEESKTVWEEGIPEGEKFDSGKLPYFTVLFKQFPNALREVIRCSNSGHNKYIKTDLDWQNFSRVTNAETRYKDASLRHMVEEGPVEDMEQYGGMTHEAAVVWNALADLEINLRNKQ